MKDCFGLAPTVEKLFQAYDYYASGADDQYTLEDNILAFRKLRLRPRVLIDISVQDISANILGIPCSFPFVIAPTAMQKMVCW
jgi:(S)-2-hydroxy-acid oxidase